MILGALSKEAPQTKPAYQVLVHCLIQVMMAALFDDVIYLKAGLVFKFLLNMLNKFKSDRLPYNYS